LNDGLRDIERLTGIPVLKVMPYLNGLAIEEEDGLSLDSPDRESRGIDSSSLDVAVIRLPRISNFTDFLALENTPGITLRYVSNPRKLGKPDLIIIPGSKNTIGDMIFLRESGFEARLLTARNARVPIFGICGGYQMLGDSIADPDGVEGETREIRGLGFLPVDTVLRGDKELSQVVGETLSLPFAESGAEFKGYEIHMGETSRADGDFSKSAPLILTTRGDRQCREYRGAVSDDGLIFGCYVHGFFDESSIRMPLLAWLAERSPGKKHCPASFFDPIAERERSFDILADHLASAAETLLKRR
jgi:adenosylcobyric acid synthase